jgi:aryl-alcohol dehydrogenase-like predicted oxidoreductase
MGAHRAFELGVTHWDTAEVYQGKAADGSVLYNETVVGKGIQAVGNRAALQIATK